MIAVNRDGREFPTGPVNSAAPRNSTTNGHRPATDTTAPAHAYEDEIVVDTKTNGIHSSSIRVPSDQEDVAMNDARDRSPEPPYPKRKRSSMFEDLDEESMERNPAGNEAWTPVARGRPPKTAQPTPPTANAKSIALGYWRDSTVPYVADRHAVVGFIDTRDRLRTRVQQLTRSGRKVPPEFPLPPGPGGSWVTFERVVFEKHLIGLDHNQIKEFVKIRTDALGTTETFEETVLAEKAAVKEAMRRAAMHPIPDNLPPPQIAYGVDLPDYVVNANRPDKKRRMGSNFGIPLPSSELGQHDLPQHANGHLPSTGSPSVVSAIQRSAIDLLPGTRPTKILLGFWRGSSEDRLEDKHAVFGILGANDMFRVKVTRETRDGRPVLGNFPQGAGALWIHYDEVEFEKHIRHLSRPEVKEYVRVRQRQIDEGEKPSERLANEGKAVYDAQARVINAGGVAQSTLGTAGRVDTISFATAANLSREMGRIVDLFESSKNDKVDKNGVPFSALPQDGRPRRESSGQELRQSRRTLDSRDARESTSSIAAAAVAASNPLVSRGGRHSLPDGAGLPAELRAANRPAPAGDAGNSHNADRVERTNSLARREISRMENIQQRNEQRAANRETAPGGANAGGSGPASGLTSPGNAINAVLPSQHNGVQATNGTGGVSATTNGGTSSRQTFSENMGRLNKVWASQEASRLRAGGEDAKIFMGVKYERKQTGPFQGKLVSPGTILSIDGEDYVEYRVLTKPTFF